MENIEDNLNNYRLRKRRQERIQHFTQRFKKFLMPGDKTTLTMEDSERKVNTSIPSSNLLCSDIEDNSDSPVLSSEEEVTNLMITDAESSLSEGLFIKYTLRIVYLAFWVTLYIIAIELQFGIVFLMFSAIVGIYLNTRTGPRKQNEISAYSVFNKNCESIDGTLKAEQFEREIGIR